MKPKDYEMFWKTIMSGQIVRGELVNKTKDGRLIPIEGSANPILDDHGAILGFLAIQRDITERKRLEAEAANKVKELEKMTKIMEGREDRIIELKNEVEELKRRPGEKG